MDEQINKLLLSSDININVELNFCIKVYYMKNIFVWPENKIRR